VPRQPDMLKAISKVYFRMWDGASAAGTLKAAIRAAMSAPAGPVALEIPVDVQRECCHPMLSFGPPANRSRDAGPASSRRSRRAHFEIAAADAVARRRRTMCNGCSTKTGGARIGIVTTTNGRGVVPENAGGTLGAFNMTPEAAAVYATCDAMLVAGSRLRGNETHNNEMTLPRPLLQIDADASQSGRNYAPDFFVHGDAGLALEGIADRLPRNWRPDRQLAYDIAIARAKSEGALRQTLGPYQVLAEELLARIPAGRHPWSAM